MLTTRQSTILEFLATSAPELAKVFEAGTCMRNDEAFPARKYFVAHAAREIINRLPDYYEAGGPAPVSRKKPTQLKDLAAQWVGDIRPQLVRLGDSSPTAEPTPIQMSLELATKLDTLVEHEATVSEYTRARFAEFLSRLQGVISEQLLDIAAEFISIDAQAWVHVPTREKLYDEALALAMWDQLEERLFSLVGPRHEIYARIASFTDELNLL